MEGHSIGNGLALAQSAALLRAGWAFVAPPVLNGDNTVMNATQVRALTEHALSHAVAVHDTRPLRDARQFLTLFSPPAYQQYPIQLLIEQWPTSRVNDSIVLETSSSPLSATGELVRVVECMKIFLDNLHLGADTLVEARFLEEKHTVGMAPCLQLRLLGPGHIPSAISVGDHFRISLVGFNDCWTRATRDGRIDLTPEGATLWLQGARQPPPPDPEAQQLLALLDGPGAFAGADAALEHLDSSVPAQPANLLRILEDVIGERRPELDQARLRVEVDGPPDLPQLILRRGRMQLFADALINYALWHVVDTAQMSIQIDYLEAERSVRLRTRLEAHQAVLMASFHLASLQRAAADHAGALEALFEGTHAQFALTLPDEVGRRLDAYLPGWERFSPRSGQVLRLLKSGAQAPPEAFMLNGILEEELERWLLPRMETPAARNLAKHLEATAPKDACAHPERAAKALAQIARGKPKKEIAQPQYAVEIIHAFAHTPKGAALLGITRPQAGELCKVLPANALASLRLLAARQE